MRLLVVILAMAMVPAPCVPLDVGQERPDLARIFTPLAARPGTYVVMTTDRAIAEVTAALKACDPAPAAGAWVSTRPEAREAFGQAGIYDRAQLAQLFGGSRLTVVRGSLPRSDGRDAYTLISPYPDARLTAINPGTLVIVVRVPRASVAPNP
jgi:hypothetical protein